MSDNKGTYTPARAEYIKKHMEKLDDIKFVFQRESVNIIKKLLKRLDYL
jgi:hypothetical protein